MHLKASALVAELLQLIQSAPQFYEASPPPYTENPDKVPPSYLTSESLAYARAPVAESAPSAPLQKSSPKSVQSSGNAAMVDTIDFGDTSAVQTRGKGAKKAAKKAQQSKWLDSGDEGGGLDGDGGNGDGGNAGGGEGGGDGGSGAGGNDDGDGGDDNNDDWDFGAKKNKKNRKSKKQEEEEKKKQEEEEQKKKEEEDAAAVNGGNFLNWADDANEANADDDWAGFTATKTKDKKKKGKKVNIPLRGKRFISDF